MTIGRRIIDLPIASVTLLEDRAHVVRRGSLALAQADERIQIERVAPVVVDKTVAVTAIEGSVKVVDARVRRRALVRLRDGDRVAEEAHGVTPGDPASSSGGDRSVGEDQLGAERAALEREGDELEAERDRIQADRDLLLRQAAALEQVASLSLADMSEDASWGDPPGAEAAAQLGQIAGEERALVDQLVERERALEEIERKMQRLSIRIAAVDRPDTEERADLEIDLAGAAGSACELRVDYVVPGACWRPWHTARLDGATVEIATDACVWQNTGEDWRGVELILSTERASLGAEPPRLASDVLRATRKSEHLMVQAREQEIDTAGLGGGGEGAARAARELPGIDDGGEVVALRAPERASVPSDGRPYRVRLASFTAEAEAQLVAFPELAPVVLLKSTQQNKGAEPLLAGPVDLVRSSGLVGRTSILFVAPGERFDLGWGPEADLRLSREVDVFEEKSRMLSSWIERDTRIRVRLSNLGAAARKLTVIERIPISEIEKVKVELDPSRTTGKQRPDENGFVRWTVDLAGFAHQELELTYQLKKHEDVRGI